MNSFLIWLSSIFTKNTIGILIKTLLIKASQPIVCDILNEQNQKIALAFVQELNARNDLTNSEKAKIFNENMLKWAKKEGLKISESVINCLRELAVNAVKAGV